MMMPPNDLCRRPRLPNPYRDLGDYARSSAKKWTQVQSTKNLRAEGVSSNKHREREYREINIASGRGEGCSGCGVGRCRAAWGDVG